MTETGKKALFDLVKSGKGFVGLHSASDTFHTPKNSKDGPEPFICLLGGVFITRGAQQVATNKVIDKNFPGFEKAGDSFTFNAEWYSLKNFNPDMHMLTVIITANMTDKPYQRPPYPTTWARKEGKGRVYYTALGHRDDVWTNLTFQNMLIGAIQWAKCEANAAIPPNLKTTAPESTPPAGLE